MLLNNIHSSRYYLTITDITDLAALDSFSVSVQVLFQNVEVGCSLSGSGLLLFIPHVAHTPLTHPTTCSLSLSKREVVIEIGREDALK